MRTKQLTLRRKQSKLNLFTLSGYDQDSPDGAITHPHNVPSPPSAQTTTWTVSPLSFYAHGGQNAVLTLAVKDASAEAQVVPVKRRRVDAQKDDVALVHAIEQSVVAVRQVNV